VTVTAQASASGPLVAGGNFFFRYRNAVFPIVLVALFALFPPPRLGGRADLWLDVLGFTIGLSGQLLRMAVIGFAYIKRGGVNKRVYAETLVTEGFFGASRNPLYLGNILMLVGLFVIEGNPIAIVIGLAFFLFAYLSIVRAEEVYLAGKFGDAYARYCRDVNRWWPNPGRLARSTAGMTFDWRRVVIKDYSTFCSWLGMAVLLFAYEEAYWRGFALPARYYFNWALVVLGLVVVALLVRWAKKSGRLVDRARA
jgi:protein-S-isoprenylcysteine O-methyltransferase Ste14